MKQMKNNERVLDPHRAEPNREIWSSSQLHKRPDCLSNQQWQRLMDNLKETKMAWLGWTTQMVLDERKQLYDGSIEE